jgi:hypothetical protein
MEDIRVDSIACETNGKTNRQMKLFSFFINI